MAHFSLIPIDSRLDRMEFDALSVATVLEVVQRYSLGQTDVYQDGPYICTISHDESGVWSIVQRKAAADFGGKRCLAPLDGMAPWPVPAVASLFLLEAA